ncbi:MAG: glycosyltransferase family 2 protein [Acetobacteraceae bacterium]|jgi:succinoglycan biosynthesis protein ExoA
MSQSSTTIRESAQSHGAEGPVLHTRQAERTAPGLTTIVVPVLNEERFIAACLDSILAQIDPGEIEIFVADGGSTDRTREIVTEMAHEHPCITLIDNPGRLQSAAVNLVATVASPRSRVLVRADAHALYPADFLRTCLRELRAHDATSVVVPMRTVGLSGFQRAVAAAQNSRLGNGGAAHRCGGASRFVDHGHHAAFDRAFFLRTGGYDESFTHNEDAEFDYRAIREGGRIWLCDQAAITYFPRDNPWRLAKQYFSFGRGRARTLLTHSLRPRARHLLPVMILLATVGGLLLAPIHPAFALPLLGYLGICTAWAVAAAIRTRDPWLLATGAAATIMHLSWAVGFLDKCLTHLLSGRGRRKGSTLVTNPHTV